MSSEADQIIGLYRRRADAWARDRGDRLFEGSWLDRFRAAVPRSTPVLDVGCGSGRPIARYLIEQGHDVVGIDSSPEMIGLCKDAFPDHAWHIADMRTLALDRAFGGVIAWNSFFHLDHDDQRRMFPIFRDHLVPGGALMFTSGPSHGVSIGSLHGEPLFHASLDEAEYQALLGGHGFTVLSHAVEDPACGGHTIWLARLEHAL